MCAQKYRFLKLSLDLLMTSRVFPATSGRPGLQPDQPRVAKTCTRLVSSEMDWNRAKNGPNY